MMRKVDDVMYVWLSVRGSTFFAFVVVAASDIFCNFFPQCLAWIVRESLFSKKSAAVSAHYFKVASAVVSI